MSINRYVVWFALAFYLAMAALTTFVIVNSGIAQRVWNAPLVDLQSDAGMAVKSFQESVSRVEMGTELTAMALDRSFDRLSWERFPESYVPVFLRNQASELLGMNALPLVLDATIIVGSDHPGLDNAVVLGSHGAEYGYLPLPAGDGSGQGRWFEGEPDGAIRRLVYFAPWNGGHGAVGLSCDFDTISLMLSRIPISRNSLLAMVDGDGALIARTPGDLSDRDVSRLAIIAAAVRPAGEGSVPAPARQVSLDGRRFYVAQAATRSGPRFISISSYWNVRSAFLLGVLSLAMLGVLAIGVSLVSSALIRRFVSVPIRRLSSEALLAFSSGIANLPVDSGPLEVRLLADTLNQAIAEADSKASQQRLLIESDARIDLLSIDLSRERISSLNGFRLFGVESRQNSMDFREWVEHFHITALEKNYNPLLSSSYQERSARDQSPEDMLSGFLEMSVGENRQREFSYDTLKGEEGFLRVNMVRASKDSVSAACVDLTEEYRTRRELFVLSTRLSYALNATQSVAIFDVSFETMELWASESFFPIFEIEMPPAGILILPGFEKRLGEGEPPLLDGSEGQAPEDIWKKGTRVFKLNLPNSRANRWIEVRTAETVRGIIGTVIDITREVLEKQAAQEKADTAQELSRVILTALTEAVLGVGREGHCVFMNPAAEILLGFRQDELVGQDLRPIFTPVDASGRGLDSASSPLQRALRDHVPATSDYERFRRKDGSFYQASIRVQPLFKGEDFIGAVATLVDVSNLVELSNRFGAMLANTVDQMYMTDRDLRVTMVSDSILQARGVTDVAAFLGKSISEIFPTDRMAEFRACEEDVLATGRPVHDLVMNMVVDGVTRWLNVAVIPLRDSQGEIIGEFGIARDVTEAYRLDEELRAAKIEAERANQAKSIFLAGMSHEIRTPLNAILGYSQLLAGRPGLGTDERRMVDTVMRSGEHLLELINSILEISKIEAGRLSLFLAAADLYRLLEDIESMFRIRTDAKGLRFEVTIDPAVPRWIVTDIQRVRQILINLLGNAVKFTAKGGVFLSASMRSGKLVFEVRDTGPGLPDDEKEKLFAPFMQGRAGINSQGGTGLGLAISREYAKLMGGRLEAENAPDGAGSVFRCELALIEAGGADPDGIASRRTVAGLADPSAAPVVLNVDDSEANRRLTRDMLEPLGFRIIDARDGREAIGAVEIAEPDVVLMDIIMPDMDGIEAIEKVRSGKKRSGIPIIAVTASAFEEDRRRVMAAGANEFIRKPIDREELLAKIGRAIGIEYRYTEATEKGAPPLPVTGPIDLAKVPEEMLRELRKAAVELAPFQAAGVVKDIAAVDPAAAAALSVMIERLDFQAIIGLLDEREKTNG